MTSGVKKLLVFVVIYMVTVSPDLQLRMNAKFFKCYIYGCLG